MAVSGESTTRMSTKGQVILPKAVRQERRWSAGTRLVVENREDGVLLREAPLFTATEPEEVFGTLAFAGKAKTLEEMDASVRAEGRRRARD